MAPGFTREQLESFRGATVPDLIGPNTQLLFVGVNPGLWTAATQTHFCHPSNRFYPALRKAGIIDWRLEPSTGMTEHQRGDLIRAGIGITNLVGHATARAAELSSEELKAELPRLESLVDELDPVVVAVAGITAFRQAFARPRAAMGSQADGIGSAELWVVPNPSGLNAHETIDSLAGWFRILADAAGLDR